MRGGIGDSGFGIWKSGAPRVWLSAGSFVSVVFVLQILFERAAGDFFHAHEKLVDPAFGFMSFEAVAASSKINSFRPQAGGLLSFV
ncbi:hypothetical protein [Lysobacter capsici]|uniref:hypothetical protein n=1 Tax=Lysobacter capsici TaxID=435897 RepID=UPI00128D429E|nr:hypothetical protein [Lysobacter capsici]